MRCLILLFLFAFVAVLAKHRCSHPIKKGNGLAHYDRYAFDHKHHKCVRFSYSGCGGNSNNFKTLKECQHACESKGKDKNVCAEPLDSGPCFARKIRYGYDSKQKKCVKFNYGGCKGNANNFETLSKCKSRCEHSRPVPQQKDCLKDLVAGPCKARIIRYGYDAKQKKCIKFTYGGCQGNENNFETLDECKSKCEQSQPAPLEKDCSKDIVTGPCAADFIRYGYDAKQKKCIKFTYGGCQGNGNNFETLDECKSKCEQSHPAPPGKDCSKEIVTGPCKARITRYGYDAKQKKCINFTYGGCQGNGNNFETLDECKSKCEKSQPAPPPPEKDCSKEIVTGPCKASIIRYGYDAKQKKCINFTYGGCQGNGNNFETLDECKSKCEKSQPAPPPPEKDCSKEIVTGPCKASIIRYGYDAKQKKCINFTYGGCQGNGNNFETLDECKSKCEKSQPAPPPPEKDCSKEIVTGPCKASIIRYGYDAKQKKCINFTYGGCQGNGNNFETLDECKSKCEKSQPAPPPTEKDCSKEIVTGPCKASIIRYGYDAKQKKCINFTYGGCQGNGNNFETLDECKSKCEKSQPAPPPPEKDCSKEIVTGPCKASIIRYGYDAKQKKCINFTYGGCQGNGNNFETLDECKSKCEKSQPAPPPPEKDCSKEIVTGPCKASIIRYGYDAKQKKCINFTYGGCQGNGNNFETLDECKSKCEKSQPAPPPPEKDCSKEIVTGPCKASIIRYGYDAKQKKCINFTYGGCQGNGNNFETLDECKSKCEKSQPAPPPPEKDCSKEIVTGPCKASIIRYGYDAKQKKCINFTYGGCQGNGNNFETLDECKSKCEKSQPAPPPPEKDCSKEIVTGPCKASIIRYGYDAKQKKCINFTYGGCQGNGNNFETLDECKSKCEKSQPAPPPPEKDCSKEIVTGPCKASIIRYGYDAKQKKCINFTYGGCQGNGNNFETLDECKSKCEKSQPAPPPPEKDCLKEIVTGPCKASIIRYGYDAKQKKCINFTYGGCQGNGNNFETLDECKSKCEKSQPAPPPPEKDCSKEIVTGPCKASIIRYGYDAKQKKCINFTYGGCQGNGNNFETLDECKSKCEKSQPAPPPPEKDCSKEIVTGPCKASIIRYGYDAKQKKCINFTYGGCQGNGNNFETLDECKSKCEKSQPAPPPPEKDCSKEIVTGPCKASIIRYGYDAKQKKCINFTYGGCQGNGNNFETLDECKSKCEKSQPAPPPPEKDCSKEIVTGPCKASIIRYGYDAKQKKCINFTYGGCQGNGNNFETLDECKSKCEKSQPAPPPPEKDCSKEIVTGPCKASIIRYGYDAKQKKCINFTYGGCQGNGNNFETLDECKSKCEKSQPAPPPPEKDCSKEIVTGPCKASIIRYGYDAKQKKCINFTYGGCQGNGNNFETLDECKSKCEKSQPAPPPPEKDCSKEIVTGPCKASIIRYGYDAKQKKCINFTYGGCQGNGNNFETLDECKSKCEKSQPAPPPPEKDCSKEIVTGPCKASIIRYGYDAKEKKCINFTYGGCQGNGNNFETLDECKSKCEKSQPAPPPPEKDCSKEIVTGPCKASIIRYGYDAKQNKCIKFVYGGCQGNGNNFETLDECTSKCEKSHPAPPKKDCSKKFVTGPCKASIIRYGYDAKQKKCIKFTYGGCQGNGNNFETLDECKSKCEQSHPAPPKKDCSKKIVTGPCKASIIRYGYDAKQKKCIKFIYGGCQGNGNNFETLDECKSKCEQSHPAPSKKDCSKKIVTGPCTADFIRYGYDAKQKKCIKFTYGGCQGNGNNFETLDECKSKCEKSQPAPPEKDCSKKIVTGPCQADFIRYGYDAKQKKCVQFIYGGCQGNGNNFETLVECQSKCEHSQPALPDKDCWKDIWTGPCKANLIRYGFDAKQNKCVQFTYGGCQGNGNNFETLVECQKKCEHAQPAPPKKDCSKDIVTGPCTANFIRYGYDAKQNKCISFVYGGCHENGNNFITLSECQRTCEQSHHVPQEGYCLLEPNPGPCPRRLTRFAYDAKENKCVTFTYGGCLGNKNNFKTLSECQKKCKRLHSAPEEDDCSLPIKKGPCKALTTRYAYSKQHKDCVSFTYGGCGGNGNNFESMSECRRMCDGGRHKTVGVGIIHVHHTHVEIDAYRRP